jgi:hypothetical protein
MAARVCGWQHLSFVLGVLVLGLPSVVHAQRLAPSRLPRSTAALVRPTELRLPRVSLAQSRDTVARAPVAPALDPASRSRGAVARRGLVVGAVVGAVVGYFFGRQEEYTGAVTGPLVGAAVGAPLGMIVLLLATPE